MRESSVCAYSRLKRPALRGVYLLILALLVDAQESLSGVVWMVGEGRSGEWWSMGDTVANRSENRHSSALGASSPTSFGCSKLDHSRDMYAGRATSSWSCRRCCCSSKD